LKWLNKKLQYDNALATSIMIFFQRILSSFSFSLSLLQFSITMIYEGRFKDKKERRKKKKVNVHSRSISIHQFDIIARERTQNKSKGVVYFY
jgi:hypothetical protein